MRRVVRIFPLYYGFLVAFFLILPYFFTLGDSFQSLSQSQSWYWTYLINLPIAYEGWPSLVVIGHFWSLAVEEQFYLFWPLVVFLSGRRQLMAICIACFVGSFVVRLGFALAGNPLASYVLTPARMDTLAMGAFLALVVRKPDGLSILSRWMWPVGIVAALALALIMGWRRGFVEVDMVVQTIGYSLLAIFFGALISVSLVVPGASALGRVFAHPGLVALGRYSYALYVFHHPVVVFMRKGMIGFGGMPVFLGSQLPGVVVFTAGAACISFILALMSWHCYEKHFLKLKVLFPYRSKSKPIEAEGYGITPSLRS
jgi:peptidoglycan/LPS O-acetylase OafA/YrhL